MSQPSVHTQQLVRWLEGMRRGEREAREDLLRNLGGRLELLARKMLRKFPNVHRWAQTDDVLQNSLLRLLRSLEKLQPASTREFFGLAATEIRRELLDLARHYYGPHGLGANYSSMEENAGQAAPQLDPAEPDGEPADLERWFAFHETVEKLPAEEREVVSLVFYHGWTQDQVAELFGVSSRTIQRHWRSALVKLHDCLGRQG